MRTKRQKQSEDVVLGGLIFKKKNSPLTMVDRCHIVANFRFYFYIFYILLLIHILALFYRWSSRFALSHSGNRVPLALKFNVRNSYD